MQDDAVFKKQAQEAPVVQPAQPPGPSPAPDPSQPSGADPGELAKKLEGVVYEDFDPLLLKQNEAAHKLEFETYDAALDEFYAKVSPLASVLLSYIARCVLPRCVYVLLWALTGNMLTARWHRV